VARERNREMVRQWQIVRAIEEARFGRTIAELAAEFAVHQRTIRRDLEALQRAGFPLYDEKRDATARWKLNRDLFKGLVDTGLTLSELCALYFSRTLLECLAGTPFQRDLRSAFAKLEEALNPALREYLDQLPGVLAAKAEPLKRREPHHNAVIALLLQASLEHRRVTMRYDSFASGGEKNYTVEPHRLAYAEGGLYLFAFVPIYGQMRTFAVERIRELSPLDEHFQPVPVDGSGVFADSLGVHTGKPEKIVIEFAPAAARHVLEREWHRSQQVTTLPGGEVRLSMTVCVDFSLQAWILSFGPLARVITPGRLADRIFEQIEEAREQYAPRMRLEPSEEPRPDTRQRQLPLARVTRSSTR
jgi:predicted DNA-binding transcriptional regulator YafY